jgi:cell division protein FtsB
MRIFVILLCVFLGFSAAAPKKTDAQIKEQRTALKKLESDLAKKREELLLL